MRDQKLKRKREEKSANKAFMCSTQQQPSCSLLAHVVVFCVVSASSFGQSVLLELRVQQSNGQLLLGGKNDIFSAIE